MIIIIQVKEHNNMCLLWAKVKESVNTMDYIHGSVHN